MKIKRYSDLKNKQTLTDFAMRPSLKELLDCTSYAKVNDDRKINEKVNWLGKGRDN